MLLVRGLIAFIVAMSFIAGPDTARADAWGCNYDKCVAYCTKVSGKTCTTYCDRRLQEKRRGGICK